MNGIMKKVFVFAVVAAMIAALGVGLAAWGAGENPTSGAVAGGAPGGPPPPQKGDPPAPFGGTAFQTRGRPLPARRSQGL